MEINTGIVTGRTEARNRGGVVVARLLQVMVSDEADVQTVQLVGQAGEESNPPNGSLVLLLGAGKAMQLSAGVADGIEPIMAVGGKRIYSTDETGAVVKGLVRLNPDGDILVQNDNTSVNVMPNGDVTVTCGGAITVYSNDAVNITAPSVVLNSDLQVNGAITATGLVTGGGTVLSTHKHGGVQTGGGQTGEPI